MIECDPPACRRAGPAHLGRRPAHRYARIGAGHGLDRAANGTRASAGPAAVAAQAIGNRKHRLRLRPSCACARRGAPAGVARNRRAVYRHQAAGRSGVPCRLASGRAGHDRCGRWQPGNDCIPLGLRGRKRPRWPALALLPEAASRRALDPGRAGLSFRPRQRRARERPRRRESDARQARVQIHPSRGRSPASHPALAASK